MNILGPTDSQSDVLILCLYSSGHAFFAIPPKKLEVGRKGLAVTGQGEGGEAGIGKTNYAATSSARAG